ncbi:2-methyl-6-phytyl-1,4-hydroquinone methyltransferase 2, chloroplastic [Gracilariopsis chorda]|uniref:2-methyl-6-phytyl-1,4-hydroquinone methyltransferase 2, chloroplastic n=1 Tax=Gracilariopsis chorda TaxID=448386 RepID=A0A2V3IML0_9FLOR|nr:2-methyl-6-phytyl-1,4-hydroquinone methyltransferase 2, chloroplastic [Gracilariopsis chorda]|eukprot:PXF43311.1 2-methyl-6-phytyl-1,4-hydroquinone methyltransferase 2, chloroplastic [Gracilariopsis chorda]
MPCHAFVAPLATAKLNASTTSSFTPRFAPRNAPLLPPRSTRCNLSMTAASQGGEGPERRRRGLIQHKREAFWFYRFLSIVYDTIVNPFHWTKEMRDRSLAQAQLECPRRDLKTIDVGGGTGFCTEGVANYIDTKHITLLDQSPHQMAKAKAKKTLQGVTFVEGDAENLPFNSAQFDRYTSAGSIEYWPEPQRGIAEAYRVLKPGGVATLIGPVRATNWFSRFWCDLWMLFPMETEYRKWFTAAGFKDLKISYIGPNAYKGVRQHGLIMGLTITGTKPADGPMESPVQLGEMLESRKVQLSMMDRLLFLPKWMLGVIAGGYYFILPFLIILYAAIFIRKKEQ